MSILRSFSIVLITTLVCLFVQLPATTLFAQENIDIDKWKNVETSGVRKMYGNEVSYGTKSVDALKHELYLQQGKHRFWTIIALCVVLFISLIVVLMFMKSTKCSAADIVNATGLIFIIFGTILLVMVADAEAQLTAAIGILGAIAGYLFGSMRNRERPERTDPSNDAK